MNLHESRIRDYLSQNIELIERGMSLIKKEYKISSNLGGAGGSIDLFAKDALGHRVIIEIKRSNQAARAAIHELTKYIALLRSSQGIKTEQIRVILLSTEWHELSIPFSEYLKTTEVSAEGFILDADEDGTVKSIRNFVPIDLTQPLHLERTQEIFLYAQENQRNNAVRHIVAAANQALITDYTILAVDYKGSNTNICYPYGAYFTFSLPENYNEKEFSWAEEEPGYNFLNRLNEFFRETFNYDDLELGLPEKLASMISKNWHAYIIHRAGRYAINKEILSDEELVLDAMQIEGGAYHYLYRTSSPKFKTEWKNLKQNLENVISGCSAWEVILGNIIEKIEIEQPESIVSLKIYNPADILLALAKGFDASNYDYFPKFQLIINSPKEISIYSGEIVWSTSTLEISSDDLFNKFFDEPTNYFLARNIGSIHNYYDELCTALGLENVVFHISNPASATETISALRQSDVNNTLDDWHPSSLKDFIAINNIFGKNLIETMKNSSVGLF